ncbi:MATE family efflux transporter [Treponema sp. OMZ 787]|uniref:MATE family efflux transporter n=1 Tax=Treponema sp. OMZ 787 TaxID=2563669 RepID=UPI0020A46303|nr:MATE family efflux transporter [Treponema sp. OMZ 787]UTC62861.1 MATE family efflux transporter [Treponema sp. OMZ 787]
MTTNLKPAVNLKSVFSDKSFLKNLFIIAVPIILQNFISSFVNILDTIMIGRLGTVELAAVGLGNQLFFLLNLILYGIGSGGMVFTAQFWGKKDFNGLQKTFAISLIVAVFFSTLFTLACTIFPKEILSLYSKDAAVIEKGVDYLSISAFCFLPFAVNFIFMITLRSIEKVRVAVAATLVSLFVNLILNAVLIFGLFGFPALGVKGAAIATVASRAAELLILFSVTKKKKYPILGKIKNHFDFDLKFIRQYFTIVMPVLINESLWSLGITFHHKIFAGIGTFAYASYNITNTVSMLTWVIFIGFGNGVSVLIGKKIGEKNYDEAKTYAAKVSIFVPFVAIFVGAMLIPISYLTPIFFNVEKIVLETVMKLFIILACCYPLKAFNMCMLVGILRAGGDTRFGIICDTAVMWCVSIPLAYFLSVYTSIPAWGIYICLFSEEPFKALLGLWRIRSGKWLRSVTD